MRPKVLMLVPNGGFFERKMFLGASILSEGCQLFPRGNISINILVPIKIKPRTSDMINQ